MPGGRQPHKPNEPRDHGQKAAEVVEAPGETAEPAAGREEPERALAEAEAVRDQHLADLQRVAADFDNYRKRIAREQQALVARAHAGLVEAILPVLDDLGRALEAAGLHEEAKLEDGVRLVHRQLSDVLTKEGLEEIPDSTSPSIHTCTRRWRRFPPGPKRGRSSRLCNVAICSAIGCCARRA